MKKQTVEVAFEELTRLATIIVRNEIVMERLFKRLNGSTPESDDILGVFFRETDNFLADNPNILLSRFPGLFDNDVRKP